MTEKINGLIDQQNFSLLIVAFQADMFQSRIHALM